METRFWFKLMILHLGLFGLFAGIAHTYEDPWAIGVGLVFAVCFIYCFAVWTGNTTINEHERKRKK